MRRHLSQTQSIARVEIGQTFLQRGAAAMSMMTNSYPTSAGNVPLLAHDSLRYELVHQAL